MALKILFALSRGELPPPSQKCPSPCPAQPLISLPRASPSQGASSAPPSPLPRGMWKPLPAAELLHPPLLVSCLSAAHTSDSQSRLTLCGAADRSSRQAAAEATAEQLLPARARDTGVGSWFYDLLSLLSHRIITAAFQQLSPNIYGQGYLALITDWVRNIKIQSNSRILTTKAS